MCFPDVKFATFAGPGQGESDAADSRRAAWQVAGGDAAGSPRRDRRRRLRLNNATCLQLTRTSCICVLAQV